MKRLWKWAQQRSSLVVKGSGEWARAVVAPFQGKRSSAVQTVHEGAVKTFWPAKINDLFSSGSFDHDHLALCPLLCSDFEGGDFNKMLKNLIEYMSNISINLHSKIFKKHGTFFRKDIFKDTWPLKFQTE